MVNRPSKPREPNSHEYDFHGMRAVEAERRLKQILDRHGRQSGAVLYIIHGKGTGTLAEIVQKIANQHPRVEHVQRQFVNDGVTRIEMA